jgi:methionine-rich copper-binding protein CopC
MSRSIPRPAALLAALLVGLLALVATPAQAHDVLLSSSPAADETVSERPGQIVLTFNNDLLDSTQAVIVADGAGQKVAEGAPTIAGPTATFALPTPLGDGAYRVTWSVVSSDGHRIDGAYGFTVAGTGAATAAPAPAASPSPTASSDVVSTPAPTTQPAAEPSGGGGVPAWVAVLVAVGVLGGVIAVAVRNWPRKG